MSILQPPTSETEIENLARYMNHLAQKCAYEVGFIPNTVYPQAILKQQVKFTEENGELCGFLLHGPPRGEVRVYQTAIEFELRRLEHGTHAIQRLIAEALEKDQEKIILHCAADLPANAFWRAAGFVPRGSRNIDHLTKRHAFRWEFICPQGEALERYLSEQLHVEKREKLLALLGQTERFLKHRKAKFRRETLPLVWKGRPRLK